MATNNTSIRATGLGAPDLGASSFVRQAPVNTSELVAGQTTAAALGMQAQGISTSAEATNAFSRSISQAVDVGLEVSKQKAVGDMIDEQNAEIDKTRAGRESAMAVGGLASGQISLFDKGASTQQLDRQEQVFQKETETYKAAYDQGHISADALRQRLMSITRQHVNRNPGMADALIGHAERVLSLSGVASLRDTQQKIDNSASKLYTKQLENVTSRADKLGLGYNIFELQDPNNLAKLETKVNERTRQVTFAHDTKTVADLQKIHNTQQADSYVDTHAYDLVQGRLNGFHLKANQVVQATTNPADIPFAMRTLIEQEKMEANRAVGKLIANASPEKRAFYDRYLDSLENLGKSVIDVKSGQAALDNLKRMVDHQNLNAEFEHNSGVTFNTHTFKTFSSSPELMQNMIQNRTGIINESIISIGDMLENNPNSKAVANSMVRSDGNNLKLKDGVVLSSNIARTGNRDGFANSLATFTEASKSGKLSPLQHAEFMDDFIATFSKPGVADQVAGRTNLTNFGGMVGNYMSYMHGVFLQRTAGKEVEAKEIPGVGVQYIVKGDPELTRRMNHFYANKVHQLTQTFANVGGVSYNEAWKVIRNQYSKELGLPREEGEGVNSKDIIKKTEGFRNSAYLDSAGVPTIGYGFTKVGGKPVKIGDTLTRDEAELELEKQIPQYQSFKNKISVPLSEAQEAALTSFEYNLGSGIWDKGANKIIDAVNSQDFSQAKELMLQYDKARDPSTGNLKQLPGLTSRRKLEGTLLAENKGEAPDFGNRADNTKKGTGWLGILPGTGKNAGQVSTEISVGVNIGGKEMEIPTLVPGLSKEEIDSLLAGDRPSDAIMDKAVAHAKKRLAQGKSPFKEEG